MSCQTCIHLVAYFWCIVHLLLSKYIECMIALFRQWAARGSWVCCRRSYWATTWWRHVSSDPLCPFNSLSRITLLKPKDWLVCIDLILVYLFGLIMVSLCYCFNLINEHDVNIYDMMTLFWWWSCDNLGDSGHFPEYLSVRTCSLSDHPG
jgi:hypothetical protein